MATDTDLTYCRWSHDDTSNDSLDTSFSQILDHGSVSFGKFAVESLSWEKWSVFSHNRCQEELEKFKSPGLVAQKKAYFEEYYKRIRMLKALQQEQEAMPALDSGGNSSVCSNNGEEHITSEFDNALSVTCHSSLSEENTIEVKLEEEISISGGSEIQYLETETFVPHAGSLKSVNDQAIEEVQKHKSGCNSPCGESIIKKDEYLSTVAEALEPEPAMPATLPELESTAQRESNTAREDNQVSNQVDLNVKKGEDCTSMPKVKGAASSIGDYPKIKGAAASVRETQKLKHNSVQKVAVSASVGSNVKLDRKLKGDAVKSSQGIKHPFLYKRTGKADESVVSKRTTSNKTLGNKRSTSISSNRQVTEPKSNITVPHRFSLKMENRASGPSSIGDGLPRHSDSKVSNRLTRLPVHRKKITELQNASLDMSVSSHRTNSEARSNTTVPHPFSFSTEKRTAGPSSAGDGAQRHSVSKGSSRLIELPVQKKSMSYMQNTSVEMAAKGDMRGTSLLNRSLVKSGSNQLREHQVSHRTSIRRDDKGEKHEMKEQTEFRHSRQTSKSAASTGFSKNGTSTVETKKITTYQSVDLRDVRKSRQGTPCWR